MNTITTTRILDRLRLAYSRCEPLPRAVMGCSFLTRMAKPAIPRVSPVTLLGWSSAWAWAITTCTTYATPSSP